MRDNQFNRKDFEALQNLLDYRFNEPEILSAAMTHSSWAHTQGNPMRNNERLEFLGDAVLELCVSDWLFRKFPDAPEGQLTSMRAHLVNGRTLGEIACDLGIPELVRKSLGAEWQSEKQRLSIGADALEAIIAAVYLDGGFENARHLVDSLILKKSALPDLKNMNLNSKNRLQEETMRLFHALPKYETISESGPEHAKTFTAMVTLPNARQFYGEGPNHKKAEQEAAAQALAKLLENGAENK